MKTIVYWVILLVIGCLAGLYQLDILMVVFLTGVFFFCMMVLLSFYLKTKVSAKLEMNSDFICRNTLTSGAVTICNPSYFPLILIQLRIEWENQLTGEKGRKIFRGSCPAKANCKLVFDWIEKSCGIVVFSLERIEIYDFFGLVKQKKKGREKKSLVVLPLGGEMEWEVGENEIGEAEREEVFAKLTDTPSDLEEIRPYMQGDFLKNVHWKLSAKMEELLSRRYHAEKANQAVIYLELRRWMESELTQVHAFLELTARVAQVLLLQSWTFRFVWESYPSQEQTEWTVQNDREYDDAMEAILEELGHRRQSQFCLDKSQIEERKTEGEIQIRIDFYANLYLNGQWIKRFGVETESGSGSWDFGETG